MKRMTTGRYVVAASAAAGLVLLGGAAFAYWTSSGTGTGTAGAGTTSAVTIAQTGSINGLFPGGTAQPVNFTITNPGTSPVTLAAVAVSVTDTTDSGCTAADFTVTQPTDIAGSIAGSNGTKSSSTATIAMKETGANQDACKGVTVHLAFAAS